MLLVGVVYGAFLWVGMEYATLHEFISFSLVDALMQWGKWGYVISTAVKIILYYMLKLDQVYWAKVRYSDYD